MKVIMLMAVTADGMIARDSSHMVDWTGKADKRYFVDVTRTAGAMIMGSKTFDTIGRALPGRVNVVMTRDSRRVSTDDNLVFTGQSPHDILTDLERRGFSSVALIGGAMVNSLFLADHLVDEVHLTVVPKFFGKGLTLFNFEMDIDLELMEVSKMGPAHILLCYRVLKP
jgi:dihydrofolate reductase